MIARCPIAMRMGGGRRRREAAAAEPEVEAAHKEVAAFAKVIAKQGANGKETIRELSGKALTNVIGGQEADTADAVPFSRNKPSGGSEPVVRARPGACSCGTAYLRTAEIDTRAWFGYQGRSEEFDNKFD